MHPILRTASLLVLSPQPHLCRSGASQPGRPAHRSRHVDHLRKIAPRARARRPGAARRNAPAPCRDSRLPQTLRVQIGKYSAAVTGHQPGVSGNRDAACVARAFRPSAAPSAAGHGRNGRSCSAIPRAGCPCQVPSAQNRMSPLLIARHQLSHTTRRAFRPTHAAMSPFAPTHACV